MITDIYRIRTLNSIYEIYVSDSGASRCRSVGLTVDKHGFTSEGPWYKVKADSDEYLEKLYIGPSFKIPGVVDTSNVQDYNHLRTVDEPKRHAARSTTVEGFFEDLTDHVVRQVKGS